MAGFKVITEVVRILIADDFESWRAKVCAVLKTRSGWEIVDEACDGIEAVTKAAKLRPDVVVIDIGMPGLNGIEAAKLIRKNSPNSKIVFLTQNTDDAIRTAALSHGAGYVLKTDVSIQLVDVVATKLRES